MRSSPIVAPPKFGAPESYTPKHLAEKILTSKSALEGERKQVTVLFADLKGSMELLADRDPEEARKLLDPVLERMMEAVHRYEGTVNQVMGDGIMALFGAPLAHEDHAVRACYAALDLQAALRRYADEVRRTRGVKLQIRVGLNSGEVVVRAVGSDLRMDYSAVGQTTHLAARMEQLADPGSTLLTADTLRLAEGFVEVKPLGPVPVKGLDAPIEVYELVGAGPVRSRLQAAASRGLTRFVGRERELEQLRVALGQTAAGRGQVVAIVGEPGVGKSRLVSEVTHSHRTHGWLIVESGSVSYGKATPYLPVIDLLKAYFKIQDRDDHREIREKVTGKALTLDEALKTSLPAFLGLLDVPVDDPTWQTLDPPQRRRQTLEAVKRLLLRESQMQPLLVVFEDLHWIDSETQALLDSVVDSLPTARVLLLTNYRPEYEHRWTSKTYYAQVRLDALPYESAEELLQSLLGDDPELQPLTTLLIERTEGNPFFLEESVRTLVETKVLIGERGAYRVARPVDPTQVPTTVQAVLAARIDRLPPEEKQLLQTAAVVGKDVPYQILAAIAEEPADTLRQRLGHLQAAEFLYETSLFSDSEYTFKHALTHDVAYATLLHERRRTLHAKIVEAIEALYPDRLTEQVERLAHHAFRGEAWEKAVLYLRQAGTKASARSANRDALASFEQGLQALQHLPEGRGKAEQAIDLRFDLRHSLYLLGDLERVFEYLREAEGLARAYQDQRRLAWVWIWMSLYLSTSGHQVEAHTLAQDARTIAHTLSDTALRIAANYYVGWACHLAGDYQQAVEALQENADALAGDRSRERFGFTGFPAVQSRCYLAWSLAERGHFDEGIAHGQEGIRLAEELHHPYSLVVGCFGLGHLYRIKGALSEAVALFERALTSSREWNLAIASPFQAWGLGHVWTLSGRVAEGRSLLQQGLKDLESLRVELFHSLILIHLGEALVLANRPGEALVAAEQALGLTRERRERGHEAYALRLLGEIASHKDSPDVETSETRYREALALATELEMRPLVAYCHLGLGTLYRRIGDQAKGDEHLATAITMYREMGMTFWLEKADAELRGVER